MAARGATPYSVISAGIKSLSGSQQAGHTETEEAFLDVVKTRANAASVISARLRRSESFPLTRLPRSTLSRGVSARGPAS